MQARLDKSLGRRDTLYGGFDFTSSRANSVSLFDFLDTTNILGVNGNAHWSHRLPHQTIANVSCSFSRERSEIRPFFSNVANVSGEDGISGNDQDATDWGPPTLEFSSGIASLSDANSTFNRNRTDGVAASAVWTHRRHNVTFGGDFRRREFNESTQQNPRGVFTFTGVATQASGNNTSSSTTGGRKKLLSSQQVRVVKTMWDSREHTRHEIAAHFGVSVQTIDRAVRANTAEAKTGGGK